MSKRKGGSNKTILIKDKKCQLDIDISFAHTKESWALGKWDQFLSGPPKQLGLEGVDLLEVDSPISCYFLDELGSMRFRDNDGIVYYVFIDDNNMPYHIDPAQVYIYKPGERVTFNKLGGKYPFYIVTS